MTSSDGPPAHHEARSIGPAAASALAQSGGAMRVHSVFAGTVNLETEGADGLVALTGPAGDGYPHAVVLDRPADFRVWQLPPGSRARLHEGFLWLQGPTGIVAVDLSRAQCPPSRSLAQIDRLGAAHGACLARLAGLQDQSGSDLSLRGLRRDPPATALGGKLCGAVQALVEAAQPFIRTPGGSVAEEDRLVGPLGDAVTALIGLGEGFTPSGDDFLCGFLAAARTSGTAARLSGLESALSRAMTASLHRTGRISGCLIRGAARGFWPGPLLDLAEALARDSGPEALAALDELGRLGHSSGTDLATGYLFGLETLLAESD